ncbi:hypothetical protein WICMUC_003735 [Wickerhamomyces mucosus]|uniref:Ribosome maturation protein SDO1/SBDS N-terminal domain-containing protein n=1 Tax=Wickerhamomyces mucosus TaxID=1378264 RepID=A0A9P8TBR4_9ASCO|nr:hypothetical protein WICMUC_003735 [Wickerhamomyces mucosus]
MTNPSKVFYKGQYKDFIVFTENDDIVDKYFKDSTIPLVDVVGTFKVFTTESGRGVEGVIHEASKQDLENEFGNGAKDDSIIEKILKEGQNKSNTNINKNSYNSTNDSYTGRF